MLEHKRRCRCYRQNNTDYNQHFLHMLSPLLSKFVGYVFIVAHFYQNFYCFFRFSFYSFVNFCETAQNCYEKIHHYHRFTGCHTRENIV